MAQKKRVEIESKDITGLKYFDKLGPMLERLHQDGCGRDKAGNRDRHFDQYCTLISLWTGRKPTLSTYEMICFYFCRLASEAELLAHIEKIILLPICIDGSRHGYRGLKRLKGRDSAVPIIVGINLVFSTMMLLSLFFRSPLTGR